MTDHQKAELKSRYTRAQKMVNDALDSYSCGLAIIRMLRPDIEAACAEIDNIKDEVKKALRKQMRIE